MTRDDAPRAAPGEAPTLSEQEAVAVASRDTSTADAAAVATRDAQTVARSAAGTVMAAQEAVAAAGVVAMSAKHATAMTVADAAGAAAELAAQAATDVHAESVARALAVAASAVAALEKIAAELPLDTDPEAAKQTAASVAATVAAEVIAQAKATTEAADRVAIAVSMAADAAALAAATAAAIVELAADTAKAAAHEVAGSSAATEAASDVAVSSSTRVADLALRRLSILRRAPLVAELRGALEREELRLHYQPMYSMSSGAIVAVEALLRWQHPTRGLLSPAEFLDIAEGPTLVTPIGDWVVGTAVSQASVWQRSLGDRAPVMWVNISCNQLGNQHLPEVVDEALSTARLAPGTLGLEVTERQIVGQDDDVAADLQSLRDLGVAMAVDDFGTGFASLDYLRRFTFDEIKIDRSFISGLGLDRTDTAVTSSIIALGRSLDLTVVAEGVETNAQFERLRELGCEISQGYLHHRPAPDVVISALLERSLAVS